MTTNQRIETLNRFAAANRWLTRVYDLRRSEEHRLALWNFLMTAADSRLRNILVFNNELDYHTTEYWSEYGRN